MEIADLVKLAQCLEGGSSKPSGPFTIGSSVLIRTVTSYWTGRIVAVYPQELAIEDAAWVANTGRFRDAVFDGTLDEVEPVCGRVIVGRGAIIDCTEWRHPLPREQK